MKAQRPEGKPQLEIQIHSSEIRRGVQYLFLSRRQITLAVLGVLAFVGYLGVSLAIAPNVIRTLLSQREYRKLVVTRAKMGDRLDALSTRLAELKGGSSQLRLEIGKIKWSYGLFEDVSIGQGGYPSEPRSVPESM